MRILLAVPLLLLGACQVSKDDNSATVSFNQDVAENAAADAGNFAENVGGMIAEVLEGMRRNGDLGDAQVEESVRRRVSELCEAFPVYPGR